MTVLICSPDPGEQSPLTSVGIYIWVRTAEMFRSCRIDFNSFVIVQWSWALVFSFSLQRWSKSTSRIWRVSLLCHSRCAIRKSAFFKICQSFKLYVSVSVFVGKELRKKKTMRESSTQHIGPVLFDIPDCSSPLFLQNASVILTPLRWKTWEGTKGS